MCVCIELHLCFQNRTAKYVASSAIFNLINEMICNLEFIKKKMRITWNATLRAFWLWFSAEFAITRTMTGRRTKDDDEVDEYLMRLQEPRGPKTKDARRWILRWAAGGAIERENLFSYSIFRVREKLGKAGATSLHRYKFVCVRLASCYIVCIHTI